MPRGVQLLKLCLGLSESDVEVLLALLDGGRRTAPEIAAALGLSRSSVSRALARLAELGLAEVERVRTGKPGRPRLVYRAAGDAYERIAARIDECVERAKAELSEMLRGRR